MSIFIEFLFKKTMLWCFFLFNKITSTLTFGLFQNHSWFCSSHFALCHSALTRHTTKPVFCVYNLSSLSLMLENPSPQNLEWGSCYQAFPSSLSLKLHITFCYVQFSSVNLWIIILFSFASSTITHSLLLSVPPSCPPPSLLFIP